MKWSYDPRTYERNFSNCVEKPAKFRTSTGFEPVTWRCRCDALTLWNHWCWELVICGLKCSRDEWINEHNDIERFHMTSRRPCWCSKTKKWPPWWCTKLILQGLNSIFMRIPSFVSVIQYGCWSREWKRTIWNGSYIELQLWNQVKLNVEFQ